VYFDFLGFFFIYYPKHIGVILNSIVIVLSIVIPHLALKQSTARSHSKHIIRETILGFFSIIFGIILAALSCYFVAQVLDKNGYALSWYTNTILAIGIYGSAMLFVIVLVYDTFDAFLGNKRSPLSLGLKVQARINGVNIFWGLFTVAVMALGSRSAYLFMIILFFNLLSSTFIYLFRLNNSGKLIFHLN
jgi:hypothetical protein